MRLNNLIINFLGVVIMTFSLALLKFNSSYFWWPTSRYRIAYHYLKFNYFIF